MGRGSASTKRKSDLDEYLPTNSKTTKRSKPNENNAQAADETDALEIENEDHDHDALIARALMAYGKGTAKKAKEKLPVVETAVEKFTAKVEEKRRMLLSILEEKCVEITTLHDEASSDLVSFAREQTLLPLSYCKSDPAQTTAVMAAPPTPRRKLTVTSHPYHEQSLKLLRSCNAVFEDYDSIAKIIDYYKDKVKVGECWHADKQQLLQVLEAGKRHTNEEIKKRMFREDKSIKSSDKVDQQKIREREVDEKLVKEMSKEEGVWKALCEAPGNARDGVENQNWAEYAGKMEKGVKRLAKCLPEEMEEEGQWA